MILLNREQSVVTDETLATMQENVSTTISTLSTQLETSIAGFTDVQKKVFEHEDNELEDQTKEKFTYKLADNGDLQVKSKSGSASNNGKY